MKPLRIRLEEARQRTGIPWEILERDYLLSWILAGISQSEPLRETLVFKGGTALKKCYFGDYRFSEDLDFSAQPGSPRGDALLKAIAEASAAATGLLDDYAPVEITCKRYTERQPHPTGQEAFTLRARLPWHRGLQTRVLIEITVDEGILKPVGARPVLHEYGEPLAAQILVYSLEEIVAEKLRALLQHARKLKERGWSRSRARDYYDLWRIFSAHREQLELGDLESLLRRKCTLRNVAFDTIESFFEPRLVDLTRETWNQWLGPLVPDLPAVEVVLDELRSELARYLPGS